MRQLLLLFLLFPLILTAQYERGNWYLSGNSSIDIGQQSTALQDVIRDDDVSRMGYFLLDRLLVGADPFAGSIFARYYQPLQQGGKLAAFAEMQIGGLYNGFGDEFYYTPSLGLEYRLAPGLVATAAVRHRNSGRVNTTTLDLSLNGIADRSFQIGAAAPVFRRGDLFIAPSLGSFSLTDPGNINLSSFTYHLNLSGGLFLTDRIVLEGSLALRNADADFENSFNDFEQDFRVFSSHLGLRYFVKNTGRFRPYFSIGAAFQQRKIEVRYDENNARDNFSQVETLFAPYAKAGFMYFLNERVAVDLGGQYNLLLNEGQGWGEQQSGLGVGFKVFLGSKREP